MAKIVQIPCLMSLKNSVESTVKESCRKFQENAFYTFTKMCDASSLEKFRFMIILTHYCLGSGLTNKNKYLRFPITTLSLRRKIVKNDNKLRLLSVLYFQLISSFVTFNLK